MTKENERTSEEEIRRFRFFKERHIERGGIGGSERGGV